jgi:hypothetical protein
VISHEWGKTRKALTTSGTYPWSFVTQILIKQFNKQLFQVLLYLFFWPLCCLFFFDRRIIIASLVSSNSSTNKYSLYTHYVSNEYSKEKVQKNKQRYTKHAYKTKDRITRTPLKTGCELRCSGRVGSPCYTSGKHIVDYCMFCR